MSTKPAHNMSFDAEQTLDTAKLHRSSEPTQPRTELYLDELTDGASGTIIVMICHSWDVHNITGHYLSTDFVMSDAKGNAIHSTAKANVAHNFLRLKEGSVYSIKNFVVQVNKEEYRIFKDHVYMIELDGATVYVAGYVTKVGRITQQKSGSQTLDFSLANGRLVLLCRVHLSLANLLTTMFFPYVQNNGQEIQMTLWGGLGDALVEWKTNNVSLYLVVLTTMNVKLYSNKLYLSSGSSTQIMDDHQIPALKALRAQNSHGEVSLSQDLICKDKRKQKRPKTDKKRKRQVQVKTRGKLPKPDQPDIRKENKMAEENVPAPTRTNEQLVLLKARLPIGKINLLMDLQKMQKNPIFRISMDILQNTNLFRAFMASADVPSIYVQ
ncbi:reverse transcriptase domain-containing protein [Tanacetum coccineum]